MKESNILDLDGRTLRTFLAILEHASVSVAAEQLGLSQPAVSRTLAKLRRIIGDPLFVRSGTELTPTKTALALKEPVQNIVDSLGGLVHRRPFDPQKERMKFIIAANDMQRDLVFPQLLRELWEEEVPAQFEFIPSGHPSIVMMRDAKCDMALTPVPPEGTDIIRASLFGGKMMCYYDSQVRDAPVDWEEFCEADHLRVKFAEQHTSLDVLHSIDKSEVREAKVAVSNFDAVPRFVKGTRLIATELDLMQLETLKDLDVAPLPFEAETVTVYLVWHQRSTNDPAHAWLRNRIRTIADTVSKRMVATYEN